MLGTVIQLAAVRVARNKFSLLCQVLALSAIMVPVLIIFGLKYGIVSSLKERLLQNPATMEVWPTEGTEFSQEMIDRIAQWEECAFVIPTIGAAYSSVNVVKGGAEPQFDADYELVPTAENDPLLVKTGVAVPQEGEAVLTEPMAAALSVKSGETVTMTAWRNGGRESMSLSLKIVGVIPAAYSHNRSQIYTRLQTAINVEQFIVEGKGKMKESAKLSGPCYNGIVTDSSDKAKVEPLKQLIPVLDLVTAQESGMAGVPGDKQVLFRAAQRITPQTADILVENAAAMGLKAYPWVTPQQVVLPEQAGGFTLQVFTLDSLTGSADNCPPPPCLYVNPAQKKAEQVTLSLPSQQGESRIKCRLLGAEEVPQDTAFASPQLLALLQRAKQVSLIWDYEEGTLYHPVLSFCHMRLYADKLENTEKLMNRLQEAGVPCNARVNSIRQVLELESGLNNLFLIICAGAGVGAAVSYAMSLFNAAELHRREYALIQLMGAGKFSLCLMPIIDAFITTLVAIGISLGVFFAASSVIGFMFRSAAGQGALCRLELFHISGFSAVCLGVALFAALSAAVKILSISPSEIIREV